MKRVIGAIGGAFFVYFFLFSPSILKAETIISVGNNIVTSTTWTTAGSPYILQGGGRLFVSGTLTIEPGVVIKVYPTIGLYIEGSLDAQGTPDQSIIFTSYRDDTIGGDTNRDGSAHSPAPGDWGGIYFDHASGTLEHVNMRYGGSFVQLVPGGWIFSDSNLIHVASSDVNIGYLEIADGRRNAITVDGTSTFSFNSSTISRVPNGLNINTPFPFVFRNNYFSSTTYFALRNDTTTTIDARHNWWGDDSGPSVVGRGDRIVGANGLDTTTTIQYDPWIGKRDPVILIPGILGSYLQRNSDDIFWVNLDRMLLDRGDEFMDPLAMNIDGTPSDSSVLVGDVVRHADLRSITVFHYFDRLINEFSSVGYTENTDLFVFPYDWRLDIHTNSILLKQKIDSVLAQTHAQKVDLVAHSMGGLLTKEYMVDYGVDSVDTVIFVGTPHLGSPDAAKTLLFGSDLSMKMVLPFLDQLEIKKIGRNMISLYQLLPSPRYFSVVGSYLIDLVTRAIPDYADTKEFLKNQGVNNAHIDRAEAFRTYALDNFQTHDGLNMYSIAGCETPTLSTIIRRNSTGNEDEYYVEFKQGDGTVPLGSANAIDISDTHRYFVRGAVHADMPSNDQIRRLIVGLVSQYVSPGAVGDKITQNVYDCKMESGRIVSIHSPVDIHVYDDSGNHVGPNTDGSVDLNIPGVAYENINNNKFVFISNDLANQYRVELQATATGTFNMRVADIVNDTPIQTTYYNAVPIVPASHGQVQLSIDPVTEHTTVNLELDRDGLNQYQTIPITSVLNATSTLDFTKPTTTVSLINSITNSTFIGWTKGSVETTLTASDDLSGVLRTEYSLDNGITWRTYTSPFNISTENTILLYRSIDEAGNMEETKTMPILIDNTSPEVAIHFDTMIKEYIFSGIDSYSSTTVSSTSPNTTILTDEAGNTTELQHTSVSTTNMKGYFTNLLEVTRVRRNGEQWQTPVRNQIFTQWQTTSTGTLRWSQDAMQIKNGFYAIAKYDVSINETTYWKKLSTGVREETGRVVGDHRFTLQTSDLSFIYY